MEDASPDRADGKPKRSYWSENLRLLGMLLSVWFTVSFGFGIPVSYTHLTLPTIYSV